MTRKINERFFSHLPIKPLVFAYPPFLLESPTSKYNDTNLLFGSIINVKQSMYNSLCTTKQVFHCYNLVNLTSLQVQQNHSYHHRIVHNEESTKTTDLYPAVIVVCFSTRISKCLNRGKH